MDIEPVNRFYENLTTPEIVTMFLTDLSDPEFTHEDCMYKYGIDLNGINPISIANVIRKKQEKVYMVEVRLNGKETEATAQEVKEDIAAILSSGNGKYHSYCVTNIEDTTYDCIR